MSREVLRAILKDDREGLDSLVKSGADLNEITEVERWSYLHRALLLTTMPPSRAMIEHLLSIGLDPSATDMHGNTPVHYAAHLNRPDLIEALIRAGANVNAVNKEGVSPLRELLLSKPYHYDSVRLLLAYGADIEQRVEGGASVKDMALSVGSGDPELLAIFQS